MNTGASTSNPTREFYTREELAERMQVSLRTVDQWIAEDKIPHTHIGRVVRIPGEKLAAVLVEATVLARGAGVQTYAGISQGQGNALRELLEPVVRQIMNAEGRMQNVEREAA